VTTAPSGAGRHLRLKWEVASGAIVLSGVAPAAAWGPRAAAAVAFPLAGAATLVELSVEHVATGATSLGERRRAAFDAWLGRGTMCLLFHQGPRLSLAGCGFVDAGRMRAIGLDAVAARTQRLPVWGGGPSARVQLWLAGPLELAAELGTRLSGERYRYHFRDEPSRYSTPRWGALGALSLRAHFP
jgi:hypothetical protein